MFLLLIVALTVLFLFHQFWWRRRNLPDGPTPLPFVGNVLSFWKSERFEYKFLEWREKYGPIYTYWLGPMAVITVNDYKVAQEMFVKTDLYNDRAPIEALDNATRGGIYGIIDTSGHLWKEQRRFALKTLRDFGLGKNKMQSNVS